MEAKETIFLETEKRIRDINKKIASELINDFYLRIPAVIIPDNDDYLVDGELITIQTLNYAIVYNIKHRQLILKEFSNGKLVTPINITSRQYEVFKNALENNKE